MAGTKGNKAEESLRLYFLDAGYYVVRGVPYKYKDFDITDIDLFLYGRASALSRERNIVDIKNKKTPQAVERIFWTKGLQKSLNMDHAIVATTETNPAVLAYGKENNVIVLDGKFLKKIQSKYANNDTRFTDEEFWSLIECYPFQKMDGNWKEKIRRAKGILLNGLNFDSINEWIELAKFFVQQALDNHQYRIIALRCLYIIFSFILIAIDFQMKELSFMSNDEKQNYLNNGFSYGSKGRDGTNHIIQTAARLIRQVARGGDGLANQIQNHLETAFNQLNSPILGEHFAKNEVSRSLFDMAKEFEACAMKKSLPHYSEMSLNLKSTLFCFIDYWEIKRQDFQEIIEPGEPA